MFFSTTDIVSTLLLLSVLSVDAIKMPCPKGIVTRKNWISHDEDFRVRYCAAYKKLYEPRNGGDSFVDSLTKIHLDYGGAVHGSPQFFPWHRYMLFKLEEELQKEDSTLSVPYWDWAAEATALGSSRIWNKFGGNGSPVTNGRFANSRVRYTSRHVLGRRFNSGRRANEIGDAASSSTVLSYLEEDTYENFQDPVEGIHGGVHVIIGGDMQSPATSPNDPVFYLHHCFIDKIWWRWQNRNGGGNMQKYGGMQAIDPRGGTSFSSNAPATPEDVLAPWKEWKVKDVYDTKNLCFTYEISSEESMADGIQLSRTLTAPQGVPGAEKTLADVFTDVPTGESRPTSDRSGTRGLQGMPSLGTPADRYVRFALRDQVKDDDPAIELLLVRSYTPVSDEWIRLNNLNATKVRGYETDNTKFIDYLNNLKGFISPTSLWNNEDALVNYVNANQKLFKATVNKVVVYVEIPDSERVYPPATRVKNMRDRVTKSLGVRNLMAGYPKIIHSVKAYRRSNSEVQID